MTHDTRVTLLFDPYNMCVGAGQRIATFADEIAAFSEIEDLLRKDPRFETIHPKTFIIEARCWPHFRSYRGVKGVVLQEATPRKRLAEALSQEPPEWLSNELIQRCRLLDRPMPAGLVEDDWAATVAAWLVPGIGEAATLASAFEASGQTTEFPSLPEDSPILTWIADRIVALGAKSLPSDTVRVLRKEFLQSGSPVSFARLWMRRTALLPLTGLGEHPLRQPEAGFEVPKDLALARQLPLVFPLSAEAHREVSKAFCKAVQSARIQKRCSFEDAVSALNALWDGVSQELGHWLDIDPQAMTEGAAQRIGKLPGYETDETARRLVGWYRPPQKAPAWNGVDERLDTWVEAYAHFLQRSFTRRDLPAAAEDPAAGFGEWLRQHPNLIFNHPERSYRLVSQRIQSALQSGRTVIVVLVDALAVHLLEEAASYLQDHLDAEPTLRTFLFAPLPTVTKVCKEAILTGRPPNECSGGLSTQVLAEAYALPPHRVLLAADWRDAERLEITPETRLLVYRFNRLDDELPTTARYVSLVEKCPEFFTRIGQLLHRWVQDCICLSTVPPLVVLTADHGFTYSQAPGGTEGNLCGLDATHRCREVNGKPNAECIDASSVAFLEKGQFRIPNHYVAILSRLHSGGNGAWVLSHGGLLPEEVIIPLVEWFGTEIVIPWPEVLFPDGVLRDRDSWVATATVRNPHPSPVLGGTIAVRFSGVEELVSVPLPRLDPGGERSLHVVFPGPNVGEGMKVPVDVTVTLRHGKAGRQDSRVVQFLFDRKLQLVERTAEQATFEEMF